MCNNCDCLSKLCTYIFGDRLGDKISAIMVAKISVFKINYLVKSCIASTAIRDVPDMWLFQQSFNSK